MQAMQCHKNDFLWTTKTSFPSNAMLTNEYNEDHSLIENIYQGKALTTWVMCKTKVLRQNA